jgi:hypothetical protein
LDLASSVEAFDVLTARINAFFAGKDPHKKPFSRDEVTQSF